MSKIEDIVQFLALIIAKLLNVAKRITPLVHKIVAAGKFGLLKQQSFSKCLVFENPIQITFC